MGKFTILAVLGLSLFGSVEGATVVYEDNCNTSPEPDMCCAYAGVPSDAHCTPRADNTEDFVVTKGSCYGNESCKIVGDLTIGERSCRGSRACKSAGSYSGSGKAIVGSNSCGDAGSCEGIGGGGLAVIGSNSCGIQV